MLSYSFVNNKIRKIDFDQYRDHIPLFHNKRFFFQTNFIFLPGEVQKPILAIFVQALAGKIFFSAVKTILLAQMKLEGTLFTFSSINIVLFSVQ